MMKKIVAAILPLMLLLALPVFSQAQAPMDQVKFGSFEAEDLRGTKPVTEAIFKKADVTLVNFWATWCGPCRDELPDLAQLSELSEGRVQVVSVLLDSLADAEGTQDEEAIEMAHILLDDAKAEFPTLVPDAWLMTLSSIVYAVPTTFVVDSNGVLLNAVEGSRTADQWITFAEQYYPDAE